MATLLKVPDLYVDLEKNYGSNAEFWKKNYPNNLTSEFKFKPIHGLTPTVGLTATANSSGDKTVLGNLKVAYPFFRGTELNVSTDTAKNLKIDVTDRNSVTPGLKVVLGTNTQELSADAEYKQQHFAASLGYSGFSSLFGASKAVSALRGSLVFGVFGASVGLESAYNLHTSVWANKLLATETIGNTTASAFASLDAQSLAAARFHSVFTNIGASLLVRVSDRTTFATKIEDAANKPILSIGTAYDVDLATQFKGKLDTANNLGLSITRQYTSAKATFAVNVNTATSTIDKYGVALTLNN